MLHRIVKTSVEYLLSLVSKSFNVAPNLLVEDDAKNIKTTLRSVTINSTISNYSERLLLNYFL